MGRFDRDNISGAKESGWKNLFLIPGKIIQWALYIGVSGKRYGQVRSQTRLARSPLMTYVYSFIAWFQFVIPFSLIFILEYFNVENAEETIGKLFFGWIGWLFSILPWLMIKISKNRNNIFNIGKRRRRYTAKTNSGNLGSVWLNNSIVKAKKRLAQKKREEAREQREKERQKKREASQRKARERASKIRANKRQREREKEKRLEIKRINKNKIDKLVENQTSEKLSETLINSKEKEILISENERLKELENKKKIKEQKKLKLEIIKKEKLELEKKRELEKKKELERKISSFIQKKIKFLMSKNKVKNLIKKYIHKDEVIKFIDYGTLNISSPSPTGYLILTDKRFLFHSKVLFLKESLTEIPLSDVLGVNFDKSLIKTNIVKFKIKDQKDLVFKDLVDNLSDAWNVEENSDFSIQYLKLKFNQN